MTTPVLPDPAEFERILRERYEPLLSADDYARVREMCGLGGVIDGEVVHPKRAGIPDDAAAEFTRSRVEGRDTVESAARALMPGLRI